jgi:hypothetical protein
MTKEPPKMEEGEVPSAGVPTSQVKMRLPIYLGLALRELDYPEIPYCPEQNWTVVQRTDDNGNKLNFAIQTCMTPNVIASYWFDEVNLVRLINMAQGALIALRQSNAASGKLLVADKQGMDNVINQAKAAGLVLPGN